LRKKGLHASEASMERGKSLPSDLPRFAKASKPIRRLIEVSKSRSDLEKADSGRA